MVISSAQNAAAKKIRALGDKKYRRLYGEYIVEGEKAVGECISAGCEISQIVCTPAHEGEYPGAVIFSDDLFSRVSDEETPQGVMAVVKMHDFPVRAPEGSCLLLDGLQDCGNVGTIIRTANAAGYKEIYLVNCADPYSPKSVRSSMGGIFRVRAMAGTYEEVLGCLEGVALICADMHGEDVYGFVPPPKFCLCIGNEGNGISRMVLSAAEHRICIPMDGTCESLNAAVAAGIAMYQLKFCKRGD